MKYVFGIALVVAAIMAGWKILEPVITNAIFQDELQDIAAELGARTGRAPPKSEVEIRAAVIQEAAKHDINLDPKQVTVRSSGPSERRVVYIAVDYTVLVNLLVYSFDLHFHPEWEVRQGYLQPR